MIKTTFEQELKEKGILCYKNVGVSMRPLIRQGKDAIVIQPKGDRRLKKYDVAFYQRISREGKRTYVLHRVLKVHPNGTYWIVGDNCVRGETVREENILGVLSRVVHQGKNRAEGFGYWLYVHTWVAWWPLRFFLLRCFGRGKRLGVTVLKALHLDEPFKTFRERHTNGK